MWGLDDNEFAKANLIYYAMLMINHTWLTWKRSCGWLEQINPNDQPGKMFVWQFNFLVKSNETMISKQLKLVGHYIRVTSCYKCEKTLALALEFFKKKCTVDFSPQWNTHP
jgi:hypothetical protein